MEKHVVYYKLSFKDTFFSVMSYYLINNHIEVAVLNQGQVTRQAAVTYINETVSQ